MRKSDRIGMAMERVVTRQLWSHVWGAVDTFAPDVGSMLAVTGGLASDPSISLGLGLVV